MPTELSPEDPQPVEGDTALPGMPSVDELAAQLETRAAAIRQQITANTDDRRTLQRETNELRVELSRVERLLKATKPRGSKGG